MEIVPLTPDRYDDLAALFDTTAITRSCYCTWFLLTGSERTAVWRAGGAREVFERDAPGHQGLTHDLLAAAVALAAAGGASAVEAVARRTGVRTGAGDAFPGHQQVYAACGFTALSAPNDKRVLMRRKV
jgi:hypothetical protein